MTRGAKTGVPDEPAVGLAGWKTAAPQTVMQAWTLVRDGI